MNADELDIEDRAELQRYLHSKFTPGRASSRSSNSKSSPAASRAARSAYAFADGREWVLKQALAKLRVKADWFSDPRRIHREALGMKVLGELTPPGSIPKLIFDDETHHVLGMEAVPQPHENWKTMLLAGRIELERLARFRTSYSASIHRNSRSRRDELRALSTIARSSNRCGLSRTTNTALAANRERRRSIELIDR